MENRRVYLDNASTTMVSGEVLNVMIPYFTDVYGNANSLHGFGRTASSGVDEARDIIAKAIGAKSGEIYFTSGGTESNNWALRGIAYANQKKGKHIIVSKIEHKSIIDTAKELENEGFEVTFVDCDADGIVSLTDLLHALRPDTVLVSVMAVNNEVGTIQHIRAIGETLRNYGCFFHVDAVQAMSVLPINVVDMEIDAMSISSHKIHGPKGVGALYVRKGVSIKKFMNGGEQEFGKRGGTTNVPAIVGFGKAMEINMRDMEYANKHIKEVRNYLLKKLEYEITDYHINGSTKLCAPNILNISFDYCDGESLLMMLDLNDIAVSTGSACASGSTEKSHVLKAMGLSADRLNSAIRLSFSADTSKEDVDYVVEVLANSVKKLRELSPLTKKKKKEVLNNV